MWSGLELILLVGTAGIILALLVLTGKSALSRDRLGQRLPVRISAAPTALGLLLVAVAALFWAGMPAASALSVASQALLLLASGALYLWTRFLGARQHTDIAEALTAASVDALTHVASHRVFQDRLIHECERAYRFGDGFALIVLDLDSFRPFNNRHGHRLGDRVLLELAGRIRSQLREIDLVARFSGDQFALILPHTFEKPGLEVAERLRHDVAAWVFLSADGTELHFTASLGLSIYPRDGKSAPELVESAVAALGVAKAMGGNQVQAAGHLSSSTAGANIVMLPYAGRGAIVRSLAAAVDVRDGYTREHSQMVSQLSTALARGIGLSGPDINRIGVGGLLHDVGKIGVPDAIFTKKGNLTPEEWSQIRRHPLLGKQIIEQAPELIDVLPLVLYHQECFDGSGYPHQLKGEDIPLGARIIATADAYHAIRSNRPYRLGRTHEEASRELLRCAGKQFDPQLVQALLAVLESDENLRAMITPDSCSFLGPTSRVAPV